SFALFFGAALAVTAFPVLARILADHGLTRTPLGLLAIGCAAVNDLAAWCLLAAVVGVARAEVGGSLLVTAGAAGFTALVVAVGRPAVARWAARYERRPVSDTAFAGVIAAALLAAAATEAIGVHAIFGAFLFGAVVPHDGRLAAAVARRLEAVVGVILLPAFFAATGMRTEIGLVSGAAAWAWCGAITLAATAGKVGGTYAAARLVGLGRRTAGGLGVLMNTRGLMELVVLTVGLDLGVIAPP